MMAKLMTNYQMITAEPMLSSRFCVKFLNKNIEINPSTVQKIDLPKFKDGKWEDIEIKFLNFLDSMTISEINKIIMNPTDVYKINIFILDPVGEEFGRWSLNCEIKSVDFGKLSYADNEKDGLLITTAVFGILDCKYEF